jgi:hypothetical protein
MIKFFATWKARVMFLLSLLLIYLSSVIALTLKEFDAFSLHGFRQAATFFTMDSNVITETTFRDYRSLELDSPKLFDIQEWNLINSFQSDFESVANGDYSIKISRIPSQVPTEIRNCANRLGMNKQLISVNLVRFRDSDNFLFVNQSKLNNTGLSFSILDGTCTQLFHQDYLKSSKAFLQIREFSLGLEEVRLPGHFAIFEGMAYLLDKQANLYMFRIDNLQDRVVFERFAKIELAPNSKFENLLNTQGFGVKGIHIHKDTLFFSVAEEINMCLKLNVYKIKLPKETDVSANIKASIFYSMPSCYNQKTANLGAVGGKMITSQNKVSMILSVGNASIWTGNEDIALDNRVGKIISIRYDSGRVRPISTGHRNPQGLCLFKGKLFSTEQGPDGGDEFNVILNGEDYGWPFVTLGHPYGSSVSLESRTKSFTVGNYVAPLLTWSPSIASGDLECPSEGTMGPWEDSFLVATLRDKSIRRLLMYQGRVISDERIPLSKRIRNIEVNGASNYLLLTDDGILLDIHLVSLVREG